MKKLLTIFLTLALLLGLASPALAATPKAVTMRVELVEGSVTIKDAGGVTLDYFEGIQLYSGYSVETGDDSCAYISLDDSKAIKLSMNTSVTIKKSGRKLQVKLMAGEIMFNVTTPLPGNESLEIRTSTMITGVRGSSGGVNAETGEIFYGTGHGIVWFRETDQTSSLYGLSQRTELWGGRIVSVNWPVKDMELSDFSALFLGEVAENPDLQNSLKMEGRFDPQDMINLLPLILEAEIAAREEAKSSAVPLPESATDSPVNGDNVNPAFNNNWDLPTIVTPPPIIDLDDFIIPDDPMNPDEPETTAYTVTWQDEDGTILETDENVSVGTVPEFNGSDPIKAADAQYTYSFAGWDSIPAAVTGDAIYTATYKETPKTYTVTWKVDDETTTVKYDYGSVIVPPADTTKTGYTFTGWGGNVPETMPAENLSFTAQWVVNTYTVTWKVDDATSTKNYDYGSVIVPPPYPTKTGYTFTGWGSAVPETMPAEDLSFTAQWDVNTYTVTWKVGNEVKELDENVPFGSFPSYDGEEPTKDPTDEYSYAFQDWTPAITDETTVTGDITYSAVFVESDRYFTITWKDGDTVIRTDSYKAGADITYYPDDPTKEGYVFDGWDGTIPEIMPAENVTFQAQWLPLYTVTFNMNGHGDPIESQSVKSGDYAVQPDDPTEDGIVFDGWYADEANTVPFTFTGTPITGATTVYAKWNAIVHVEIPEASEIAVYIDNVRYDEPRSIPLGSEIEIKLTNGDAYIAGPATKLMAGTDTIAEGAQISETTDGFSYTVTGEVTITLNDLYRVINNTNLPEDSISERSAIIGDVVITEAAFTKDEAYTIEGDLYITETGSLTIEYAEYPTLIDTGATLTNKGALIIDSDASLSNDGTLFNEGSLLIADYATLDNLSILKQQNNGRIYSFGEITNDEDEGLTGQIVNDEGSLMLILGSMSKIGNSTIVNNGLAITDDLESNYDDFEETKTPFYGGLCDDTMEEVTIEILNNSTYWYLINEPDDKELIIDGNGVIPDYEYDEEGDWVNTPWLAEWDGFSDLLIEINSGVTRIGNYAFYGLGSRSIRVIIASSVTSIGDHAFEFNNSNESCELHFRGDPPMLGSNSLPDSFTLYCHNTEAWEEAIEGAYGVSGPTVQYYD